MALVLALPAATAHYTQTALSAPVDCALGASHYQAQLAACPATDRFSCQFACAKAYTALSDYAAQCDPGAAADAEYLRVQRSCGRLEPWRINGAPLTKLECGAPADAEDGLNAHLGEVHEACGALEKGGSVCPDNCREPFTVLANYYSECRVSPAAEHEAARRAGCTPLEPSLHEACACAAAANNWTVSCYNEEAMQAAAKVLRDGSCDEMEGSVPRCAVPSTACYNAFQLVQAHHDYCHSADIPTAAADAFHDFVGMCSECHVLRDRLAGLPDCAAVADCADTTAAEAALAALRALDASSAASASCTLDCAPHYGVLQAYHDGCEGIERSSAAVREGFHAFAARCERSGCNSLAGFADPNLAGGCAAAGAGARRAAAHGGGGAGGVVAALLVLALLLALLQWRRRLAARGLAPVLTAAWPCVRLVPAAAARGAAKAQPARPATHSLLAAAGADAAPAAPLAAPPAEHATPYATPPPAAEEKPPV